MGLKSFSSIHFNIYDDEYFSRDHLGSPQICAHPHRRSEEIAEDNNNTDKTQKTIK
jgi:hypothetical protein